MGVGSGALNAPQPHSIRAAQAVSARLFHKKGSFKGLHLVFKNKILRRDFYREFLQYIKKDSKGTAKQKNRGCFRIGNTPGWKKNYA